MIENASLSTKYIPSMKPRLLYIRMLRSRPAQVVCSLWQQIDRNDLFTHVAALTYTTVLSVVPLLALLLAVGRGFGLDRYLEAQLRDHVSLPDHIVTQLMDFANSYISRTQDDIVVGVSFLVLAFTLISLVNNIERRFNAMWGINTSRSIFSFSLSYLGLIVFLIFAIFFLSGVWVVVLKLLNYLPHVSLIDNSAPVIFWIVKALVVSGVFALMFKYIPLVPVRWRSIYFPALLTGTLFCAVQDLYVNSQLFISSYNAVYGSFAILPLLMMWLYVTWSICLGGVALCHTLEQQAQPFADEKDVLLNRQMSDVVALRLMGLLARRFLGGQPSWPVHRLARELRLPVRTTFDALERLRSAGYLYRVPAAEENSGDANCHRAVYKVDVDVHLLTVGAVLQRFDVLGTGLSAAQFGRTPESRETWSAVLTLRRDWGHLFTEDIPISEI